ncbi:hypothetical protein C8R43DRAFT_1029120 [Mycena crocata]|nr:hypothetical protein C8R43DRAFT_1029120 [Mycena crocata]
MGSSCSPEHPGWLYRRVKGVASCASQQTCWSRPILLEAIWQSPPASTPAQPWPGLRASPAYSLLSNPSRPPTNPQDPSRRLEIDFASPHFTLIQPPRTSKSNTQPACTSQRDVALFVRPSSNYTSTPSPGRHRHRYRLCPPTYTSTYLHTNSRTFYITDTHTFPLVTYSLTHLLYSPLFTLIISSSHTSTVL